MSSEGSAGDLLCDRLLVLFQIHVFQVGSPPRLHERLLLLQPFPFHRTHIVWNVLASKKFFKWVFKRCAFARCRMTHILVLIILNIFWHHSISGGSTYFTMSTRFTNGRLYLHGNRGVQKLNQLIYTWSVRGRSGFGGSVLGLLLSELSPAVQLDSESGVVFIRVPLPWKLVTILRCTITGKKKTQLCNVDDGKCVRKPN